MSHSPFECARFTQKALYFFTSSNFTTPFRGEIELNHGIFGMSRTVTFSTPCFSSAGIGPEAFPSGSFILGNSVALQILTANGTVTFLGTANQLTGEIVGNYTVVGGTCDQTASNPWDY